MDHEANFNQVCWEDSLKAARKQETHPAFLIVGKTPGEIAVLRAQVGRTI